jgi:hypothetical protein
LTPGREFRQVTVLKKMSWVQVPVRWFQQLRNYAQQNNGARAKLVCFKEEITGTKATTTKNCPGFQSQ